MGEGALLIAFVGAQRMAELAWAERNRRRLIALGGVECGRAHYAWMIALHAAWLATLFLLARDNIVGRMLLTVFLGLQLIRLWILVSLGRRWTTRIIVLPDAPLIARGPYRFLRHPNYLVVAAEIAVVPLALGMPGTAVLFSLLNAAMLWRRIRAESAALASAATTPRVRPDAFPEHDQALAKHGRSL